MPESVFILIDHNRFYVGDYNEVGEGYFSRPNI